MSWHVPAHIVPTGELEGREDWEQRVVQDRLIVPTGELEGREDPVPVSA